MNQRKNEFVNMVAHQLQAPLTAIIAAIGLSLLVGVMVYVFLMRKMTGEMVLAAGCDAPSQLS